MSQGTENCTNALPKASVTPLPPLSEPMTNLPPVSYATLKSEENYTEVTVLSNGLRVASEKKFGQFCTAGGKISMYYNYMLSYCIVNNRLYL